MGVLKRLSWVLIASLLFNQQSFSRSLKNEYFVVLKEKPIYGFTVETVKQKKKLVQNLNNKIRSLGGEVKESYSFAFLGSFVKLKKALSKFCNAIQVFK